MVPVFDAGTGLRAVPFARDLATHSDRVAVVTRDGEVSYRDLAARVDAVGRRLGAERRLVLLAGANTVDSLVGYLAALAAGHPLLLVPGDAGGTVESMIATYDPDVVLTGGAGGLVVAERRTVSAHAPHPDLALLLCTSGSTGSAKLVRLSHANLQANAESIASYLAIDRADRAATTLPMHYCYGLSVINSHLSRGAGLILTDRSVADPDFWDLFRAHRGTTFAGVPYTFDLLDRVGFASMALPHLRYVTQAGGRLAPDRVRRYATIGRRDGWDLVVMYGQTEATARMAYLPPDLAASHPHCVGVPIPGGSFRLEPLSEWPDPDTGELVYAGPNVMLGYAESPADLALGRTVDELHTGDIARRTTDGLYEIVGRRSRFAKIFGLRIDLHRVETALDRHGLVACCVDDGDELVVAVSGGGDPARARRLAAQSCRLPARAIRACAVAELPRRPNGKPDYPAVAALARPGTRVPAPRAHSDPPDLAGLRDLFADILGRSDVTGDDTFVGLGGDSLSYVEMSIRLEQALGRLPTDWHTTPIRDLRAAASRPAPRPAKPRGTGAPPRTATLDTSVALRAVAILLIVGTHAKLFDLSGGAHLLLGVAGFNFARFHLTSTAPRERLRGIGRSIGRIAVASACWIALAALLLTDDYTLANVLLANYLVGPPGRFNDFWFVETLVYILAAALVVLAVRPVDRAERRFPFGLPMVLMCLGLVTRYHFIPGVHLPTPAVAFWLFAIGWAGAKATTATQRLCLTLAIVTTVPGFHGDLPREAVMMGGLALLVWVPAVPSRHRLNRVAAVLAGSSLYIYLTHWQVYPHLDDRSPLLAVLASLAVGIGYAAVATRATTRLPSLLAAGLRRAGTAVGRRRAGRAQLPSGGEPADAAARRRTHAGAVGPGPVCRGS